MLSFLPPFPARLLAGLLLCPSTLLGLPAVRRDPGQALLPFAAAQRLYLKDHEA